MRLTCLHAAVPCQYLFCIYQAATEAIVGAAPDSMNLHASYMLSKTWKVMCP